MHAGKGTVMFCFTCTCGLTLLILYSLDLRTSRKEALSTKFMRLVVNKSYGQQLDKFNISRLEPRKIVVLVYTSFFAIKEWVTVPKENCSGARKSKMPCSLPWFDLTYDKERFEESDLVIFHARDMPALDHLRMLLKIRPRTQRWVYFLKESPNATPPTKPLNGLFNLTWTYRIDSDLWVPYGRYARWDSFGPTSETDMDFSKNKSKKVAWMVSNCGPQLRKSLVHELKKYIEVDVYGGCSKEFGEAMACSRGPQCEAFIKQYKFYLSFENALCEDYITEKYWSHLGQENVIPVVLGGADYSKLGILHSYINVMDFKTVEELAKYLHYLDKNNTAFNEYFKWRQKYQIIPGQPLLCAVCDVFGSENPLEPKVYSDLETYWVKQGKCNEKDQTIRNMWLSS